MSRFLFVYGIRGMPQAGGRELTRAWQTLLDGLGSNLVDAGNPVFARSSRGNCPPDDTVLGGYSSASAADLESAIKLSDGCPALRAGGCVEVGELTQLSIESVSTTSQDHARALASLRDPIFLVSGKNEVELSQSCRKAGPSRSATAFAATTMFLSEPYLPITSPAIRLVENGHQAGRSYEHRFRGSGSGR